MSDPLWDGSAPDDELAQLERALSPLRHRAPLRELPPRRRKRTPYYVAGGVAIAAAAAFLLWPRGHDAPRAGFHYQMAGKDGTLAVGGVLETGADTATLQVADIGTVELGDDSRLSLVATGPQQHRLSLERGRLHAKVSAPPRLFVVDTPAASAVDLGCEYDLEVGPDGAGILRVTLGKVELASSTGTVVVPMGAMAKITPGRGPGLPAMNSSRADLRVLIDRFDGGDHGCVGDLLLAAQKSDTLTLYELLPRVSDDDRARVFDRITQLIPLPPSIARDRVARGDPQAFAELREFLEPYWYNPP